MEALQAELKQAQAETKEAHAMFRQTLLMLEAIDPILNYAPMPERIVAKIRNQIQVFQKYAIAQ